MAALGDPVLAEEVRQAKARLDATFGVLQRLIRSGAVQQQQQGVQQQQQGVQQQQQQGVQQQQQGVQQQQQQGQGDGDLLLFDREGGAGLTRELWYWAWLSVQVGPHASSRAALPSL